MKLWPRVWCLVFLTHGVEVEGKIVGECLAARHRTHSRTDNPEIRGKRQPILDYRAQDSGAMIPVLTGSQPAGEGW